MGIVLRLQLSLKGKALEAVRSRLLYPAGLACFKRCEPCSDDNPFSVIQDSEHAIAKNRKALDAH